MQYERTMTKLIGGGDRLTAEAKLYSLVGQPAHFSVTGELKHYGHEYAGGCLHEEIGKHFPVLRPVIAVHLSDENGVPMHAEANALYWAEKGEIDALAHHLRVSVDQAQIIASYVSSDPNPTEAMRYQVSTLKPMWAKQAALAIEVLNS